MLPTDTVAFTSTRLRWFIGGLLFLSTVVNYVDRQTLSVLAPYLQKEYAWTNTDFAWIIIAFRVAYSIGQTVAGKWLDRVGTRTGLSFAVLWYSVAAMLTSLAVGFKSFAAFRFLLGAGEAANWPGATKAVSEWFPRRESGWAVALFDSGSSVGAAIAPVLVLWLFHRFGTWRPVFVITGSLGLIWLLLFRRLYYPPESHPWISAEERAYILADRDPIEAAADGTPAAGPVPSKRLLGLRQTWGIILGKALTDPVWFFITDWFAIYLVAKGFALEDSLLAFWVPFLAADAGNFLGGGISSYLIGRGVSVGTARKLVIAVGGLGMSSLVISLTLNELGPAGGLLRGGHLFVCGAVDHGVEPAGGPLPSAGRGVGERLQRNWRRTGDDRRHARHRRRHRPLLLRARSGRRQHRAAPRGGGGADPGAQHRRERRRRASAHLILLFGGRPLTAGRVRPLWACGGPRCEALAPPGAQAFSLLSAAGSTSEADASSR